MPKSDQADRVSHRVHDLLRAEILDGSLAPGDAVPSERVLAVRFGVNRHAVREALKRLQEAGLIEIRQGGSTRVLNWRDAGGLPVLLDLLSDNLDPPVEIARSVVEMRASIGVDAARHCAGRASAGKRREIETLADTAAGFVGVDDEKLDLAFGILWEAIIVGSDNIAYRLAFNSLMKAVLLKSEMAQRIRPSNAPLIRDLGKAIGAGDEERTVEVARAMLEPDIRVFDA